MGWRHFAKTLASFIAISALLFIQACSNPEATDEFCKLLQTHAEVGPLFPHRVDGEPVPNHEALEVLRDLAGTSPEEIKTDLEILLAEAEALVAEAETRINPNATIEVPAAPTKTAVSAAQVATIAFIENVCAIDVS